MTTSLPKNSADERMAITLDGAAQAASTSVAPNDLGDNTPVGWFPNLGGTKLAKGTQLAIRATTVADRDLLATAAAGQEFGLIVTARKFDNGDPSTGDVIIEETVTNVYTKDADDPTGWDNTHSIHVSLPTSFEAEELNIQTIIPTTSGSQPSGLKIYAI